MSTPSDILREQELMEQMKRENLAERQRVIDSMKPKTIEIQQYIEKINNASPAIIVGIVLVIIAILWLLYVLFVKKSMSGMWLYDRAEFLIDHDKFSGDIKVSIPKMPNMKVSTHKVNNGSFLLTIDGEPDMFFIYDNKFDKFYVLKYFKDGSPTNDEDKKESTASRIILNVKTSANSVSANSVSASSASASSASASSASASSASANSASASSAASVPVGPLPVVVVSQVGPAPPVFNNVQYNKKKLNGLWEQEGNTSDVLLMKYDSNSETIEILDKSGKKTMAKSKLIGNSFNFRVNKAMEITYTFNDAFDTMSSIIMPGNMTGAVYKAK